MPSFIVLATMKGRFFADSGNVYDNFQMMGYVEASSPSDAVTAFFEQPPYPISWEDVDYLWAERLVADPDNSRYSDYQQVYIESLRRKWEVQG